MAKATFFPLSPPRNRGEGVARRRRPGPAARGAWAAMEWGKREREGREGEEEKKKKKENGKRKKKKKKKKKRRERDGGNHGGDRDWTRTRAGRA